MRKKIKRGIALILAMLIVVTTNTGNMYAMDDSGLGTTDTREGETSQTDTPESYVEEPSDPGDAAALDNSEMDMKQNEENAQDAGPAGSNGAGAVPASDAVMSEADGLTDGAEDEKLFDMSASVSTSSPVLSGLGFTYYIHYNVPPLEEQGKSYTSAQITVELPAHVHVKTTETGALSVTGVDIDSSSLLPLDEGKTMLLINLVNPMPVGTAKDISINLTTDNFEIADDTKIKLAPELTAIADGYKVTGSVPENKKPEVTIRADDGWNMTKAVGEIQEEEGYYLIPYTIKAVNQQSGTDADSNRYGRLQIESFSITDSLPSLTDGTKSDGRLIGYPEHGGAEIVSVTMGSEQKQISYTTESYTDGSIKSITFEDYEKSSSSAQNIGDDKPITTTYTVTLKYPKNPYITSSDEQLKEYVLQNQAKLEYKLLGKDAKMVEDRADVILGEKEPVGTSYGLTVEKLGKIGDCEFNISEAGGTAKFALYKDKDCKMLASDITGNSTAGEEQSTDESTGRVTFSNLRKGTYYLKETSVPSGFKEMAPNPLKIELGPAVMVETSDSAKVTDAGILQITDTTDELGIVEFYKFGQNAEGNIDKIAGAAFILTNENDGKKYEAVSAGDGLVRFYAVPAGTYSLAEKSVEDDQYIVSSKIINGITVTGNQVTVPEGLDTILFQGEHTEGYLNISKKGILKIQKVSSKDTAITLSGAEFEVYGPYENESDDIKESDKSTATLVTGPDGTAVSGPLDAGFYILKEIKAPGGYAVNPQKIYTKVEVKANTVTPDGTYKIENDPMIPFTIHKQGVVAASDGNTAYTEELPGAKFEIYDAQGNLKGTLTTGLDQGGKAISQTLELAPGTYSYKETEVPGGYTPIEGSVDFTLPLTGDSPSQLLVINYAYYGQIKIVKTDAADSNKYLSGAEFGIYEDEACTRLIETVTTGADGIAVSKLLPVDSDSGKAYWVKETKAPDGYALLALAGEKVIVNKGRQETVEKTNLALANIQITKTDSKSNQPIKGVKYGLYTKNATSGYDPVLDAEFKHIVQITGQNGICTFSGLMPDTEYYVKELETDSSYVLDGTMQGPIRTKEGTDSIKVTEVSYQNDRKAKLLVNKTTTMDAENGDEVPMAGVEFTLYHYDAQAENGIGAQAGTAVTQIQGDGTKAQAVFDSLVPGEYILVETGLPSEEAGGYAPLNYRQKITVHAGDNQTGQGYGQNIISVKNEPVNGRLKIEKIGQYADGTNQKNIEASFKLYTDQTCTSAALDVSGKEIVLNLTEANTIAQSGWISPGTYYLKEETVDSEYTLWTEPIEIQIEKGKTTEKTDVNALLNNKKGKINLKKQAAFQIKDSEGDNKVYYDLKGSAFVLIKKTGTLAQDVTADNFTQALADSNAKVDLTNSSSGMSGWMDAGEYWIVEYKTPENYTMDPSQGSYVDNIQTNGAGVYVWNNVCTVISGKVSDAVSDTVTVDNITDKGKLRLFKRAFTETGALLDGAQFETYIVDAVNGTDTQIETKDGEITVKLRKVNISNSSDAGGQVMESGTSGTGGAVTVDIEPGTYYLKEISTDKIKNGPWYWYDQWTGPIEVETGKETQVTVLNYTMHGEGTKVNQEGAPQKGAVFGVFEKEEDAQNMASYIQNNNISIYNANPESITQEQKSRLEQYKDNIQDQEFLTEKGILQTAVSDEEGKFFFNGLTPGEDYYVIELLAPSQFEISGDVKKVTIKEDGTGFTQDLNFQNYKLGKFKVVKYTRLNTKLYAVEGVSFKVYKPKMDQTGIIKDMEQYGDSEIVAEGTTDAQGYYTSILLPAGQYIIFEDSVPVNGIVDKNPDSSQNHRIVTVTRDNTNTEYAEMEDGKGFYNPPSKGKFIVKKITAPVSGGVVSVEFQLEKLTVGNWEKMNTFTVNTNGAQYESGFLDAGIYRVYETNATGLTMAYTKDNPLQFQVEGGKITGCTVPGGVFTGEDGTTTGTPSTEADINQPMEIQNQRQGSLSIKKQGAFGSGESLSDIVGLNGVKFTLYKKVSGNAEADCKNTDNFVASKTTADMDSQKGVAVWNNLDAGSYWLKEDSLEQNSNYTLDSEIREITIESGKKNSTYFESPIVNYTTHGKLQIKKVDANNTGKVLRATYNIYTDQECTNQAKDINGGLASITTDPGTGIGISGLLGKGEYYLKEAREPDGYIRDTKAYGPYTVESNKITDETQLPLTDQKLFAIEVTKKDTKTNSVLKGAEIGLYNSPACSGSDLLESAVSNGEGIVRFENLTVDGDSGEKTYYVKEIAAPAGYDLNEQVFEVLIKYSDFEQTGNPIYPVEIGNDQLGKIQLLKKGNWQNIDEQSQTQIPLAGAEFKIYPVSGQNVEHSSDTEAADTIVTGGTGYAVTKGLAAGWYEIVETKAPAGYAKITDSFWAEVKNNETEETYVNTPIMNVPNKGRFTIEKYDGSAEQGGLTLIGNSRAAEFKLEQKIAGDWKSVGGENIKVADGKYTSNPMEPGEYRLIETVAPIHTYEQDNHSYSVEFALDSTPIEFTIYAGQTVGVNQAEGGLDNPAVYNSPLGSIRLTKQGDQNENERLAGAAFELYTDEQCQNKVDNSLKYTGNDGTILWEKLLPGDYWVKEVSTESSDKMLDQKGYGMNGTPSKVTIKSGQLLKADLTEKVTVINHADKGKLLIIKEDENGNTPLSGAVFEIYAQRKGGGWENQPVDTVTVAETGSYSSLLPADDAGTKYKVVETKAPSGYTLDSTLSELEKIVTVYPLHKPEKGKEENKNVVTFLNRKLDTVSGFASGVKKQVRKAGTSVWTGDAVSEKSLLESDYTAEFLVNGYADGRNDIGASKFTVTDHDIVMEKKSGEQGKYEAITATEKDYRINSVTLLPTKNGQDTEKVTAVVYIQKTLQDKANNTWYQYKKVLDVSTEQSVIFSSSQVLAEGEKVVGVKVEYGNVGPGFTSEGLVLNVTFLNRSEWSAIEDSEVRRIVNRADLEWTSKKADESGQSAGDSAALKSNPVYITLPLYKESLPEVSITNQILNKKSTYYSGDNIQYQIVAENHVADGKNESLIGPAVSMRMPAMTVLKSSLNGNGYVNGFQITLRRADGTTTVIPVSAYKAMNRETSAPLTAQGNDRYTESDTLKSTQYIFQFDDSIVLKPGDRIIINYTGVITYEAKGDNGVTSLVCPAYLSSTKKAAVSLENPLGLSFIPYKQASSQELHDNDIIDAALSDRLQYMNDTAVAEVSDSKVVQLVKYIGTKNQDGNIEWKGPGQRAQLNPNETYYYKLVLLNNSTEAIAKARIVDILPFNGDSYVMKAGGSYTNRGTTIPSGAGFEAVTAENLETNDNKLRLYSTNHDWAVRNDNESEENGILGMMYNRTSGFAGNGWENGINSNATALGFDVDFGGENLEPYNSYEIVFKVKAPGHTADKLQDYYEKVIENSAMASVTRAGTESNKTIELSDRMEPEKVTAVLTLPTGSIGDYVWFDHDNDGIQGTKEDGDEPAQGIKVTLYKKTYFKFNGNTTYKEEAVDETVTDQNGSYRFDGLACKYLKAGASAGSEEPDDYVGSEYYEYRVHFDITGYTATERYQGTDPAKDSNIDQNGYTEYISLSVEEGAGGTLMGQQDMTIDAGLVSPYALGDYVWLDKNNDGIQGEDEPGVKGVTVFLYKVNAGGEVADSYYARTTTDADGKYLFENLIQGKYVIEFDISNLRKAEDSYTYRYDFTKAGEQIDNAQSDAKYPVDKDGRIRRTDVITLTREALDEAAGNDGVEMNRDLRWDAGLVVYSAVGGFCFDDQDYNDIHTLNIPLEGTVVTLFEKDGNDIGKEIGTTTTGADGKYYFDHLIFSGDWQTYLIRFDYPDGYTGVDSNAGEDDTVDSDVVYDSSYWDWDSLGRDGRKAGYAEVTLKKDTVDTTWDAGARKYSTIGDYVWEDENKNGQQDDGEAPVGGVKVVLQSREGQDGTWKFYAQTATDEYGRYLFTKVKSSDKISAQYRVVFALDPKTKVTTCQQFGVSDALNSDAIDSYQYGILQGAPEYPITGGYVTRMLKPGYGETDLTWDAGIVRLMSAVGDYVWYDDDYSGVQDERKTPAADIPVALEYNAAGDLENEDAWTAAGEMVTDEYGKYLFDSLPEGYYRVRVQVPNGYTITKYGQTADLEADSDAMIRGENRWFYTKTFYLEAGVTDLSWDAGIYKPKVRVITDTKERVITRTVINTNGKAGQTKTGDDATVTGFIVLLAISGGTVGFLLYRKKRNKKS